MKLKSKFHKLKNRNTLGEVRKMEENSHVIAYGCVKKNSSKPSLNSPEAYHKLAKDFYDNAIGFYELCKVAAPTLYPVSMALHTNACLACELFLKSLLLAEEFDFYHKMDRSENRHNLYDLYNHLSEEGRNWIKRNTCPENERDFDIELKNIGNGFEVIRYIAECRGMMVDVGFLYTLMRSLAGISKYIVEQL